MNNKCTNVILKNICISILFPALVLAAHPITAEETERTVVVGVYENPPLLYCSKNTQGQGLFADLIEHIAEKEGWEITYVSGTWKESLIKLQNGKIDILPAIAFSTERALTYRFNKYTVFSNWGQIYTSNDSNISNFLELQDKTIAVVEHDIHNIGENGIQNTLERFSVDCKFLEVETYKDVMQAIESGQAEAGVVNRLNGKMLSGSHNVRPSPILFNPIEMRYATSANSENHEVLQKIDFYLARMKQDPHSYYERLLDTYVRGYSSERFIPKWFYYISIVLGLTLIAAAILMFLFKTQLKLRKEDLRLSRENLRITLNSIGDGVISTDLNGHIQSINPVAERLTGWKHEESHGLHLSKVLCLKTSNPDATVANLLQKVLHNREVIRLTLDTVLISRTGHKYQIESSFAPIENRTNHIKGAVLVFHDKTESYQKELHLRDITAREQAEENLKQQLKEKETLIKEIHHRVKNNLNVVVSLLNLQKESIDSISAARDAFNKSSDRIYSMALVHESLYQSDHLSSVDMHSYVQRIVDYMRASLNPSKRIDFSLNLNHISLDITKAVPCGIILNELVTNAIKHAFNNSDAGNITINFKYIEYNFVEFSVYDNGEDFPENFSIENSNSLGINLIKVLTNQIDGTLKITRHNGKEFSITFPQKTKSS